MRYPEQLFILSNTLFECLSFDDIEKTIKLLKEMDLHKPPYDEWAVQMDGPMAAKYFCEEGEEPNIVDAGWIERVHFSSMEVTRSYTGYRGNLVNVIDDKYDEGQHDIDMFIRDLCIVSLITKGVDREVKESKLAKISSNGKGVKRFRYSTTLSVSKSLYRSDNKTGRTVRPHLRRGHIKRVHYGPGRQYIRKTWIEPCFVNATGIEQLGRTHYNVLGD